MNGFSLFTKVHPTLKMSRSAGSPGLPVFCKPTQVTGGKSKSSLRLSGEACGMRAVSLAMAHIF